MHARRNHKATVYMWGFILVMSAASTVVPVVAK